MVERSAPRYNQTFLSSTDFERGQAIFRKAAAAMVDTVFGPEFDELATIPDFKLSRPNVAEGRHNPPARSLENLLSNIATGEVLSVLGKQRDWTKASTITTFFRDLHQSCTPDYSDDHVLYGQLFDTPEVVSPPLATPTKSHRCYVSAGGKQGPRLTQHDGLFRKSRIELNEDKTNGSPKYMYLYREGSKYKRRRACILANYTTRLPALKHYYALRRWVQILGETLLVAVLDALAEKVPYPNHDVITKLIQYIRDKADLPTMDGLGGLNRQLPISQVLAEKVWTVPKVAIIRGIWDRYLHDRGTPISQINEEMAQAINRFDTTFECTVSSVARVHMKNGLHRCYAKVIQGVGRTAIRLTTPQKDKLVTMYKAHSLAFQRRSHVCIVTGNKLRYRASIVYRVLQGRGLIENDEARTRSIEPLPPDDSIDQDVKNLTFVVSQATDNTDRAVSMLVHLVWQELGVNICRSYARIAVRMQYYNLGMIQLVGNSETWLIPEGAFTLLLTEMERPEVRLASHTKYTLSRVLSEKLLGTEFERFFKHILDHIDDNSWKKWTYEAGLDRLRSRLRRSQENGDRLVISPNYHYSVKNKTVGSGIVLLLERFFLEKWVITDPEDVNRGRDCAEALEIINAHHPNGYQIGERPTTLEVVHFTKA